MMLRADKAAPLDDIAARLQRAEASPSEVNGLEATSGLHVFDSVYSDPVFLIDGFLPKGISLLCGRPKVGKSWLALDIALAIACGRPLFDALPVNRCHRVLYLALEESKRRTCGRMKRMTDREIYLDNLQFVYKIDPLLAGGAAQLDAHLKKAPADLVIIDTLLSVLQAGGRSADIMRAEYREVNTIRELAEKHSAAILVVHHLRKMSADYHVDAVAGTTGLTAACDGIMTLRKKPDGSATLDIVGRELEEKTLGLQFDSGERIGWRLVGEGAVIGLSEERREILELLRDEAPLTPAKIASMLRKNAVTVRRLLQKLHADSQVVKGTDQKYRLGPEGSAYLREQRERVNA